jgi:DNA invertase Pin-like site-specific DNA recombinase
MTVRIYVRASTKDQDATRALADLVALSTSYDDNYMDTLSTSVVRNSIDQY